MKIVFSITMIVLTLLTRPALATTYHIVPDKSQISFSGTHAGNAFEGVIEQWQAEIRFDPEHLTASSFSARFDLSSARTGNMMYDGTLPQADWFDVKNHPHAVFASHLITRNANGSYQAKGNLTIRGITKPVHFDVNISDISVTPVTADGSLIIDRLAFDIGKQSDAGAEWVGRDIDVTFSIHANPL